MEQLAKMVRDGQIKMIGASRGARYIRNGKKLPE
jgi:hypothetical protein